MSRATSMVQVDVAKLLLGAFKASGELILAHDCEKDWSRADETTRGEFEAHAREFLSAIRGRRA